MKKNTIGLSVPWAEAIETYGSTRGTQLPLRTGKTALMEVGKYYQTSCENESPCFVKVIDDNTMLLAIKSPLAVLIQHGLFTMAGAKEISNTLFEKEMNAIIFELQTIKNTHA